MSIMAWSMTAIRQALQHGVAAVDESPPLAEQAQGRELTGNSMDSAKQATPLVSPKQLHLLGTESSSA